MLVARLYLLNDSFAHQLISGSLVILKTMVGLSKVRCYCLRLYLLNASFSHILIADLLVIWKVLLVLPAPLPYLLIFMNNFL